MGSVSLKMRTALLILSSFLCFHSLVGSTSTPLDEIDIKAYEAKLNKSKKYRVIFHPRFKTQLFTKIVEPIESIHYRMGDSFKKDAILIQLKNNTIQGEYEKARSALEKAKAKLTAAQELYKDGISSYFELKEAEAALAGAKSDFITAQNALDATFIKAPYSGKVVSLFVEQHELPPKSQQLMEIIDDRVLVAKLLVKADLLDKIDVNHPLKITLPSGAVIAAKVSRIGAMIDPSSSTIKVEAEIDNSNGLLKPGMIGVAIFEFEER